MANFFDQFDGGSPPKNFFDQFDGPDDAAPAKKKFGLEDTWPAKLAKSIYSAVTLPGDVMAGKANVPGSEAAQAIPGAVPFGSPESSCERIADLAMLGSPMSAANGTGRLIAREAGLGKPAQPPPLPTDGMTRVRISTAPDNGIVEAAKRISEVAPETVNVPRAFASDSIAVQRGGQMARNVPILGDSIPRATGEMVDQLGGAVQSIASHYGDGAGPNVASRISRNIGGTAEQEALAARTAAQQSDAALLADWEAAQARTLDAIQGREANALEATRRAVGDMSPQEMGQVLNARLRAGEAEARANKERLYEIAGRSDASISAASVREVRGRVAESLANDGWRIEPVLTPAASRMMTELDNIASLRLPNRVASSSVPGGGDVAAVNIQGIESTRKVLNRLRQAASNDADRAASRQIVREFDNWLNDAFDNALFSGSDEALNAFRAARAANTNWRQRFFNDENEAGKFVERIVTGEITPQETANYIVGAGQVGAKGASSRLLTRIAEATGGDQEAMQAIRGGVWNRLSQSTAGVDAKSGAKVANDINEFLNGSGRDVAQRLFTPEQQGIMRTYADTLRRGGEAREMLAQVSKTTKPSASPVNMGPMEELAQAVLGKGGKTDEALFNAIDAYAKAGGRGDLRTLSDLIKNIPAQDKGDLAGAIIRKLGHSSQSNGFSPDIFASEWSKYTPQAKAILFGNAGPHRQALDDIALISQRYKDVGKRFGNPSGTAQNVNLLATAVWLFTEPFTAVSSLVGGTVAAKILSSPAGASSAAKFSKAAETAQRSPGPASMAALQMASRNLANTVANLGTNVSAADFIRALQSPSKAAAEDDQSSVPRQVRQ
jgi:hypothetical protein